MLKYVKASASPPFEQCINTDHVTIDMGEGMIFHGNSRKDLVKGYGHLTHNGKVIYQGHFKNGKFHGFGIYYNLEDGGSYEGNFSNCLYHGYG